MIDPSRALLKERGLEPKKSFGQNFLTDTWHLASIADAVCAGASVPVVEFGPGAGALTERLLERASRVIGVERDRDLVPLLEERFAGSGLEVVEANAGTFDPRSVVPEGPYALCGNLPYHMTSTICFAARERWRDLSSVVFLVQKEVAERIAAGPGSKTYGIMSVLLQSVFDVEYLFSVPRQCFWPAPKVDGGVFRMVPKKAAVHDTDDEEFITLVKGAFSARRKTLRNTLKQWVDAEGFERAGVNPGARAETLSPEDFARLAKEASFGQKPLSRKSARQAKLAQEKS